MNEAKRMHGELLNGLLPIIPRTTSHDIRRLNTLVWAVVGLCLIVAITTLHLTSIRVGVVHAEKRRWVDTDWDRGLSYLKLGWRWRRQQYQRGWQAFAPFWPDPAPDPLPALASRRAAIEERNDADFPTAA